MKTYLSLAAAPTGEDCAQVGTTGYWDRALAECARLIRLLRSKMGPEPKGAWLSVEWFEHDFGPYCEVVCYYNTDIQASVEYAFHCEDNLPPGMTDPAHQYHTAAPKRRHRGLIVDSISPRLLTSISDSSTNGPSDYRCP